ncbi:Crp/Fnr family transcriptional regulator [Pseudomonas oryzihabitans]|uniref:Crp/Fnr family transcriptional regulator n=1 Tax=Pseudomonas oryzihabitans TaxID=47885 RepID=UPI0028619FD8|nr:Crp/Fnr family transcriptional regulator [Pseudomonas psychrotolerans]MDR6679607.1 CRP-like cAMP-binding protein [Pseudomonas psychrotolerans]
MLDIHTRQQLLKRSNLFQGMPESLLRYVATHAVERTLDDHEILFLKHDAPTFFGLIVQGCIHSVLHGPDGREQILDRNQSGDVVGELALLSSEARESTAQAFGNAQLLVLGQRHFAMLRQETLLLKRLSDLLCRRLLGSVELLESVCLHRLESRLARYLLANLANGASDEQPLPSVSLPESQCILAAMLNTSRPKLNVQLQQWRRLGLITGQRNCIYIHDLNQLRRRAYLA